MADLTMPSLGADMDSGTLLEWRIAPGDQVKRGDVVAVVDTDKAALDVEIFFDGEVTELLIEPGEKVPVGTPLARLRVAEEAAVTPAGVPREAVAPPTAEPAAAPAETPTRSPTESRLRVSPAARKRARELGVDPARITGTGPHQSITVSDIEAASRAAGPGDRGARIRGAIAAAMARSNRDIPHYYLSTTVALGPTMRWLKEQNEQRPVSERLLVGAVFMRAVALTLRDFPALSGSYDGGFRPGEGIHVGMVVSLRGGGVIVPAIRDADHKSLDETMAAMRDLVTRARSGALRSSDLSEGTITVTSLGERAAEAVFGVIFPPQVALVGFGSVVDRPFVVDRAIAIEPVVTVTLAADHRASDGHLGGRFLTALEARLRAPHS